MLKYFIMGAAYGLAFGIIFPLLHFDELGWPQGLLIAALIGLALGLCQSVIYRMFLAKKKTAS